MASPLEPIKEAIEGGTGVSANKTGTGLWVVTADGWVDSVKFTARESGATVAEAAEKVMAQINEIRGV